MEKKRILIVGGGLAGLALYAALDKGRYDVTIAEKRPWLGNLGFGILLFPVGLNALRRLGIGQDIVARHGTPYSEFRKHDHEGNLTAAMDLGHEGARGLASRLPAPSDTPGRAR